MDIQYTKTSVLLLSISYIPESQRLLYVFLINGKRHDFCATLIDQHSIKGVDYTDELDELMISLMPLDNCISKRLISLSWRYIEGVSLEFPVKLI